jgi:uncharacterized protein
MARLFRSDGMQLTGDAVPGWVQQSYQRFRAMMEDPDPAFPCHFAVMGEKQGLLRYSYVEAGEANQAEALVGGMQAYFEEHPTIQGRSALIVFADPGAETERLSDYESRFWRILQSVHDLDPEPWPADAPTDPEDARWEYCFGGQPIFITGHAPLYEQRRSRSSSNELLLVIQSRANLDGIVGESTTAEAVRQKIRAAVRVYDNMDPSPDLGIFGKPAVREWKQYWLQDTNEDRPRTCPLVINRKAAATS